MLGRTLQAHRLISVPSGKQAQSPAAIGWWLNSADSPPRAPFGQRKMLRTTSMTETACFRGSAIVALRCDSGDAPPGPGKNREAKAPRPGWPVQRLRRPLAAFPKTSALPFWPVTAAPFCRGQDRLPRLHAARESYRLARLAGKFGPEVSLHDLRIVSPRAEARRKQKLLRRIFAEP